MGIFAIAIGTVLLPTLSKLDVSKEKLTFIDSIKKGQKFVLFIGIPSLIGLMFCAEDLISTIFYRGAFTELDVVKSSYSLIAFSFGLPFFMLMKVLTPAFFARKDTKTPMYVAIVSLFLNASLNYLLAFTFGLGHVGIAIGSSIAALVSVIILEAILYKDGFLKMNGIFNKFNLMILLSSTALIAFLYIYTSWINFMELNQIKRVFFLLIEITISIAIYFSISRLVFNRPLKQMFD
jgi:putative peptidoglycan lipid II flippase